MQPRNFLITPVQYIKGVGPKVAEIFHTKDIYTVGDLLHYFPRDYRDQKAVSSLHQLIEGQYCIIEGRVSSKKSTGNFRSKQCVVQLITLDGSWINLRYFKIPFKGFLDSIEIDQELKVGGVVTLHKGHPEFHHPDFLLKDAEDEGLAPIYSVIGKLSQARIRKIINSAIEWIAGQEQEIEVLPKYVIKNQKLMTYIDSLRDIHQSPSASIDEYRNYQALSQKTLIFYEFFILQLHLCLRKLEVQTQSSISLKGTDLILNQFKKSLPFDLTSAQLKVFEEIKEDLKQKIPMRRLVQGDVGCGKTFVAFMAIIHAFESGYQSALMVPTEILAEQHFTNAKKWLETCSIPVDLLTSKMKNKSQSLDRIRSGECGLCIGTHALIQDSVQFQKLGLVIIDEQHRFGVEQRTQLIKKEKKHPHCLVMTATPIPRSLAMTAYGDLDISIIDEFPKGRGVVVTKKTQKRRDVFEFLVKEVSKGRQGYVVYPLVEESEKIDLKNASEQFKKLQAAFPDVSWGLLHGKMNTLEKLKVMKQFESGQIQVLVTTTVIEVGVDVPNANVMIIEHAERFGLSQLHQLRGRIRRGGHKGYCILILGDKVSNESKVRSQIMEKTDDGFSIADEDLKLRGAGEFLGTRQSGSMHFKLANLTRDRDLLKQARKEAQSFIQKDPLFREEQHYYLRESLQQVYKIRQP